MLSYAGTLAITITTDVEACPDGPQLRLLLQEELDALVAQGEPRAQGEAEGDRPDIDSDPRVRSQPTSP